MSNAGLVTEDQVIASIWKTIEGSLRDERASIVAEIRAYPSPITACDAQFNHLLEERSRVLQELNQMQAAQIGDSTTSDPAERIRDFVANSKFLDVDEIERIRVRLASTGSI